MSAGAPSSGSEDPQGEQWITPQRRAGVAPRGEIGLERAGDNAIRANAGRAGGQADEWPPARAADQILGGGNGAAGRPEGQFLGGGQGAGTRGRGLDDTASVDWLAMSEDERMYDPTIGEPASTRARSEGQEETQGEVDSYWDSSAGWFGDGAESSGMITESSGRVAGDAHQEMLLDLEDLEGGDDGAFRTPDRTRGGVTLGGNDDDSADETLSETWRRIALESEEEAARREQRQQWAEEANRIITLDWETTREALRRDGEDV